MSIILSTLNARFSHASLGLRYLMANMGELTHITQLQEFVIGIKAADVVEKLLAHQPTIIGFGVYIWNVDELTHIVSLLKRVAPNVIIVLGGPEVSYETQDQAIVKLADLCICRRANYPVGELLGECIDCKDSACHSLERIGSPDPNGIRPHLRTIDPCCDEPKTLKVVGSHGEAIGD